MKEIKQLLSMTVLMSLSLLCACSSEEPAAVSNGNPVSESTFNISIEEALGNADRMFAAIGSHKTRSDRKVSSIERLGKTTRSTDSDDVTDGFYVVNYANDGGFAILSADRRVTPVFALSEEGSLHLEDTVSNEGLDWYINEHMPALASTTIKNPIDTTSYPFDPIVIPWSYYKKHSDPLLPDVLSKFGQGAPYNQYLGAPTGTSRYVVGCGPLAVGTVMGYYEWPNCADGYSLNWSLLKGDGRNSGWARLFELLGRPKYLNVTKGTQYSDFTFSQDIMQRTFSRMGYSGTSVSSFSTSVIEDELSNGHPVLAHGQVSNDPTHAYLWVIDGGYTTGHEESPVSPDMEPRKIFLTYYHCVWGESGKGNGYYLYKNSIIGGTPHDVDSDSSYEPPVYRNLKICHGYRPVR